MGASTKSRQVVYTCYDAAGQHFSYGIPGTAFDYSRNLVVSETTTSEGHRWPLPKGEAWDSGGNFYNRKGKVTECIVPQVDYVVPSGPYAGSWLSGLVGGTYWPTTLAGLTASSDSALITLGSTAVSRCSPLRSKAQLGVALGELREGLPKMVGASLLKKEARHFRSIGAEYLNVEFGWKPLISDLRATVKSLSQASAILTQLSRDSGKPVRRRYAFPSEVVSLQPSVTSNYVGCPMLVTNCYSKLGKATLTKRTLRDVWFSGCFMYHLPNGKDFLSRVDRWQMEAHRLLGLRLDPETLWNLAPWTWLADWFGNFGDVVANASSYLFDGLVMKYGYLMEHKVEEREYTSTPWTYQGGPTVSDRLVCLLESKRRIKATPFGFGLTLSSFTDWQWSILAALGISRGHRTV